MNDTQKITKIFTDRGFVQQSSEELSFFRGTVATGDYIMCTIAKNLHSVVFVRADAYSSGTNEISKQSVDELIAELKQIV